MKTDNDYITITVKSGDKSLQQTLTQYADLNAWITVFKTILINQTFHEDLIKEVFPDADYSDEEFLDSFKDEEEPVIISDDWDKMLDASGRNKCATKEDFYYTSWEEYGKALDIKRNSWRNEKGISPSDIKDFDRIRLFLHIDLQDTYEATGRLMDQATNKPQTWEAYGKKLDQERADETDTEIYLLHYYPFDDFRFKLGIDKQSTLEATGRLMDLANPEVVWAAKHEREFRAACK